MICCRLAGLTCNCWPHILHHWANPAGSKRRSLAALLDCACLFNYRSHACLPSNNFLFDYGLPSHLRSSASLFDFASFMGSPCILLLIMTCQWNKWRPFYYFCSSKTLFSVLPSLVMIAWRPFHYFCSSKTCFSTPEFGGDCFMNRKSKTNGDLSIILFFQNIVSVLPSVAMIALRTGMLSK